MKEPYGQYFKEQVRRELVERFGWQRVYQGGLRVYTTIDMPTAEGGRGGRRRRRWPTSSSAAATRTARARRRTRTQRRRPTSCRRALVAIDPADRRRARDGRRPRLRREPLQPRRAGAAPARLGVQAVRLRRGARGGLHAGDASSTTSTIRSRPPQGAWTPEDEHSTRRLDDAARRRCGRRATAPRCGCCSRSASRTPVSTRRRLGVGDVPSVPSLALGSGEVTLQSLTAAYAAFANQGMRAARRS